MGHVWRYRMGGHAMTKTRDLKIGDVVDTEPLGCYPNEITVVTHVGGTCDSPYHLGHTFVIVTDYDRDTNEPTGAESDWCAPSDKEFWTVVGQRPDLAQRWADDNREDY